MYYVNYQLPFKYKCTIPFSSSNDLYTISPPSSCTVGLILVSKISLINYTTSVSSSLILFKNKENGNRK